MNLYSVTSHNVNIMMPPENYIYYRVEKNPKFFIEPSKRTW